MEYKDSAFYLFLNLQGLVGVRERERTLKYEAEGMGDGELPMSYDTYNLDKSEEQGLISVVRNNKATLILTIPCPFLVVCKGFIFSNISINLHGLEQAFLLRQLPSGMILGRSLIVFD